MYELIMFRRNEQQTLIFLGFQSQEDFAFVCTKGERNEHPNVIYASTTPNYRSYDITSTGYGDVRIQHFINYALYDVLYLRAQLIVSPILTRNIMDWILHTFPEGNNNGMGCYQKFRKYTV